MPDLQAIDRIKESVNQLANEPAILSELGVSLEDVRPEEHRTDAELDALLDDNLSEESPNLDEMLSQDSPDEDDLFSDLDEVPSVEMEDNLDLDEEDFPMAVQDSETADMDSDLDLPEFDDSDLSEEIQDDESLDSPDIDLDEVSQEEMPQSEAVTNEDIADIEDLGDIENLDEIEDLNEVEDLSLEDLDDVEELDDIEEITPAEELSEFELSPEGEDPPEIADTLENLSTELEEAELAGEMEAADLDDDFGLNELGDDFLEDMDDDSGEGSFSLDDLGQEFSLMDEEEQISSDLGLDLDSLEKSIDDAEEQSHEDEFELTSDEMVQLKEALYHLPRNLKLELEEMMADSETPVDQLNKIISSLLNKAPVKNIASQVSKVRGKKIEVPKGYQKQNLEEYQREKGTLINLFGEEVLPKVITGLVGFAALWLLFILGFNFIYRPLKAHQLYKAGNEHITLDEYDRADYLFEQAFFGWNVGKFSVKGWARKDWFYEYASNYINRRKYDRAANKYRELLMAYPDEDQGRLEYADLLNHYMADFRRSVKILQYANPVYIREADQGERDYDDIPVRELTEIDDKEILLKLGDTYFLWGELDSSHYEDARYIYSYIRDFIYGGDEVVLRMLRYFLVMDIRDEIERWIPVYMEKEKIYADDTFLSETMSELAGWLLDRRRFGEAEQILEKANEADKRIPDMHYQYARYFRMIHNRERERGALTNALGYLSRDNLSRKKYIFMKIDSYKRLGELEQDMGDIRQAERNFLMGLSIFEDSQSRNLIGTTEEIGEIYNAVGELQYNYHQDYDQALLYFQKAVDNMYSTPQLHYHLGYIYYTHKKQYDNALLEFYKTSRAIPGDRNVLFAMGNTLFQREDYFGAVSHYERLLTQLREEEQRIGLLLPEQKEEHLALIIQLMKVFNNLGTAQYKVAERSPNRSMVSESLSQYTYSSEYYDRLTRNQDTLVRSDIPDMGYQNRMTVLQDRDIGALDGRDVLIYDELLTEMDALPLTY